MDALNGTTQIAGSDIRFRIIFTRAKGDALNLQDCTISMFVKNTGISLSTATAGINRTVNNKDYQEAEVTIPGTQTTKLSGKKVEYYFQIVTQSNTRIIDRSYTGEFAIAAP